MQQLRIMLFYILILLWNTSIIATNIILPPKSLNSSEGSNGVFTCTVGQTQAIIYWTIDGLQSGLYNDVETPNIQPLGNNTLLSTLIVPALLEYNQSSIVCGTLVNGIVTQSDPVILLIQGILNPVSNLTSELTDQTTITARWVPPYSLDSVPISNYSLTVTGILFGYTQTYILSNTTEQYMFQLPSQCEQYTLSLVTNNGAGSGVNNTIIVYKIQATRIIPHTVETMISVPSQSTSPVAKIMFNITHNCSILLNHTINVAIDDTILTYGYYTTNNSNEVIMIILDQLKHDTLYTIDIWDNTIGGDSNTVTTGLSSYDVQNVSIVISDDGDLCATCFFLEGSEAGGCVIELSVFGIYTDYTSVHLTRNTHEHDITGCVKNLIPGRYRIEVFDVEKEGFKLSNAKPAFTIESVVISEPLIPTPSVPTATVLPTTQFITTASNARTVVTTPTDVDRNTALKSNNNITYRNSAIGVGVVIILVIIVLVVLIIIQLTKLGRRKQLNEGIIAETDVIHLQTQASSDTTTTTIISSNTPSPLIETMSHDVEAPPPPRPPAQTRLLSEQLSNNTSNTITSPQTSDLPSPDLPSPDLPSPGTESTTSLLRTERTITGQRPSSYHGPSTGTTDYQSYESNRQRAINRMRMPSLHSTGVMTAWAAVNPLTLPVLPEAPPPYDEIDRESNHYHRPHSALIIPSLDSSTVSDSACNRPQLQYARLQFSSSNDNVVSRTRSHHHSDPPIHSTGGVQYAIISSNNTFISSHDRLSTDYVTDSLV